MSVEEILGFVGHGSVKVEIGYHGLGKIGIDGLWLVMVGVVGHFVEVAVVVEC